MNLLSLLSSAGDASQMDGVDVVAAKRQQDNTPGPTAPDMGNTRYNEQAQAALAANPEHKGMFGVKGTLRDVLGHLGDAFLTQAGRDQQYAPKRQQERSSDALAGFTEDPLGAIERLNQVDPKAAQTLYDNLQQNAARMQNSKSLEDNRQSLAQDRINDNKLKFGQSAAAMLGVPKDPGAYKIAYGIAKRRAEAAGYDLEKDFGITEQYDPGQSAALYNSGLTPAQANTANTAVTAEQGRNKRAELGEQGKDRRVAIQQAGANRRDNPPQETPTGMLNRFLNIPPEKRTQEQSDFIKKQTTAPKSSRRSGSIAPTATTPTAAGTKYRIVNGKAVPVK